MIIILLLFQTAFAQELQPEKLDLTFKDGVMFRQEDNDFMMRLRFRVQTRFTATTKTADESDLEQAEFTVRRTRLRMDGHALSPNLLYRVQLSFTRGDQDWDNSQVPNILRDAVAGYRWYPSHTLWVGLAKLPGNRQRVISSSAQEFVDRSLLNATFNVDRDAGLQHYSQFWSERPIWLKLAVSNGEGRNQPNDNASMATTARVEWYPLGSFHDDGDNFEADLYREPEPRMGLGVATSANQKTARTGGQLGKDLGTDEWRSMETRFVDFVYKQRGFSLSAEYAKRTAGNPLVSPKLFVYEGEGLNVQGGYVFESNWQPAIRYTSIWAAPEIRTVAQDTRQYTAGLSKYIKNHVVKVQSDLTYQELMPQHALEYASSWSLRLQLELGI
jgi:hypothetical protein